MRRILGILVLFLTFFAFWVAVAASLGREAVPARYLLSEQCIRPQFELSRQVLVHSSEIRGKIVVIGNRAFIEDITVRLDDPSQIVGIRIPGAQLRDYADAIRIFTRMGADELLLQNLPRFWTDFDSPYEFGSQHIGIIETALELGDPNRLFRDALNNIRWSARLVSEKCHEKESEYPLTERFLWSQFLPEDEIQEIQGDFGGRSDHQQHQSAHVSWVFDPNWIPSDTSEETRARLLEFTLHGQFVEPLGRFISKDGIASIVAK